MQAIEDKILNKIKKCGRGKLYSASDFAVYGSAVSVAKALERLTRKGGLVRIARGLYCYPKIDRKFGMGIQYPTINEIAEKVARQSEARVVPTGMHALNVLGLSAQVPMNYVFYTDGNSRTVNLFNGRKLRFKRVALKNLAYQNKTLMLAVFALKEIGRPQVTEEHTAQLKTIFARIPKSSILPDLRLVPAWIRKIIMSFYSSCRAFITFKGGTSLSKGWHVIERFSEDIDIAIDKSFWRIAGDNKSQRDRIRKLSRAYIEQRLVAEMQALLEGYGASDFELRAVPAQDSDADPTLVLLPYRSIYANIEYVESQIRIEFSCRSMKEPRERIEIRPLIAEAYPDVFGELVFPIYAVVPSRTFLEKAFLLHEEFQKENPRVERMTRHLYDLERLMDTDFGKAALADPKMYVEIVRHRSIFNTIRGVDYRTHHPSRIDFIPPEKLAEVWRRDYERMQEYFIYGDSLPYDRLIARMAELRDRFRKVVMEDDFFSESEL